MKITIEWTVEELKELWITDNATTVTNCYTNTETVVNTNDWITTEYGWIVFRYQWKEWRLSKENEKKSDWDEYFTYDEAIKHCKKFQDRHLPSIEERQELLKARCELKGYKMDWNAVYSCDNEADNIGKEFAEDFYLPFAGYRDYSNACVSGQGSYGLYWSSSPYGSDYPTYARILSLNSSGVGAYDFGYRANARSVRCFKSSTVPKTK